MKVFRRRALPFEPAPGCFAVDNFLGSWSYLLTGDPTLLIDTGVPGRASAILRAINTIGLTLSAIDRIVLTHFDLDHSGSALELQERTGAPIVTHEVEAPYLAAPETCPRLRKLLYWPLITRIIGWRRPAGVDVVAEGDMLGEWHVLHTPGHTPGSMSLRRGDVLVVGDTIVYKRGRLQENVPWLATNFDQQRKSARRLATISARVVLPGHYGPCTDPGALRSLHQRLAQRKQ
jgi:glyoxylase-like metal-dependent hydrolase (beta-lactamase superfamily II)